MIGLAPSAFPAGELMQSIGEVLFPNVNGAVRGLVIGFGSVVLMGLLSFFLVARSSKKAGGDSGSSRRSFLVGAGAGAAGVVAAGAGLYARAFQAALNGGRGWLCVPGTRTGAVGRLATKGDRRRSGGSRSRIVVHLRHQSAARSSIAALGQLDVRGGTLERTSVFGSGVS